MKMETQKIVNSLADSDDAFQNLQQENGTYLMTKIMDTMMKEIKVIQLLILKQKILN